MARGSAEVGSRKLTLGALAHMTLPSRDAQESKRFWVDLLGAEVHIDNPSFVEVRIGGAILGFSENSPLLGSRNAEAPHCAFYVDPDVMLPLKERLEANGVVTQALWTRNGSTAHMYFRDCSGNMVELYAPGFANAGDLPRQPTDGGDLAIDYAALGYDWKG